MGLFPGRKKTLGRYPDGVIILPPPKRYRGSIGYSKFETKSGILLLSKDRPFKRERYQVVPEEFEWLTNYRRASALWYYKHMVGTAHHYSGRNINPMYKHLLDGERI